MGQPLTQPHLVGTHDNAPLNKFVTSGIAPQKLLEHRWGEDWLVGVNSQRFWQAVEVNLDRFSQGKACPGVLIAEREPLPFLASFFAACALNCRVYLGNPEWGTREWQRVWQQCEPDFVIGTVGEVRAAAPNQAPLWPEGSICIPTGGSSGQIKFAVHTWYTLTASVEGFRQHFQVEQVNAYCVLPLHHVSGLMQAMRTFTSGGKLALQSFKQLEGGNRLEFSPSESFISLVPTQLQRLLHQGDDWATWLRHFRAVLLGGAPAWSCLLDDARSLTVPLALTYGMTETASQVTTLLPEEFLRGMTCSGRALPHAQIEILDEAGHPLSPGQVGQIVLKVRSLALNSRPKDFPPLSKGSREDLTPFAFCPDDLGYLDTQGYLYVVGRNSTKIITGGENVFPEEVEAVLRETGLVADVCVVGLPDESWGQAIAAVYVPQRQGPWWDCPLGTQLQQAIATQLSKYKQPKHWIAVQSLPRNAQGKVNRRAVLELALNMHS
ncbi:MAG TPA: 2-succinylbenzoate--CoA ligase [Trichocoleus sp.]